MKGLVTYALIIIGIILLFYCFGIAMEDLAPKYFEGFPSGFTVEVFGMITEIAIIIVFINKLIEYRDSKRLDERRAPVLRSLREMITESHIKISYLLLHELKLLDRPPETIQDIEITQLKSTHYFNLESLKRTIEQIRKFQTTIAHILSGEDTVKIHEYLESLEYVKLRVEFYLGTLEAREPQCAVNIKFDKLQLERCESFYLYIKNAAPCSDKEFFKSSMMVTLEENLPTAEQLISLCRKNQYVKVVNSQSLDETS